MFLRKLKQRLSGASPAPEWEKFGRMSYAQEGEDVLLWRILDGQHRPGTYVEVGGNHPFHCSNTAFFYLRGWRGIVIEPNPAFAGEFQKHRPEDVFVNCGVGRAKATLDYYRFDEPLLNTFAASMAQEADKKGASKLLGVDKIEVRPLAAILRERWPNGRRLDLLSIDAEGMDEEVILSHDFESFPARFVILEAESLQLSQLPNSAVDLLMLERDYVAVSKFWKSALYAERSFVESKER